MNSYTFINSHKWISDFVLLCFVEEIIEVITHLYRIKYSWILESSEKRYTFVSHQFWYDLVNKRLQLTIHTCSLYIWTVTLHNRFLDVTKTIQKVFACTFNYYDIHTAKRLFNSPVFSVFNEKFQGFVLSQESQLVFQLHSRKPCKANIEELLSFYLNEIIMRLLTLL